MNRRVAACVALMLFAGTAPALTPEERAASVKYVLALQRPDGGFLPAGDAKAADLRGTSSALRAVKYLGGEVPKEARAKAAAFVTSCFDDKAGGFAARPGGTPDVTTTAVGLMAVAELAAECKATTPDAARLAAGGREFLKANAKGFEEVRIAAAGVEALGEKGGPAWQAWYDEVAKSRNADGSWGGDKDRVRATGGSAVVLMRLNEGKLDSADAVAKLLAGGQAADGGYAKEAGGKSDAETTYRVLRALHMLKARPADAEKLRGFVASCRNADGGYGTTPGGASSVGGTYFAAVVLHWLE